MGRASPGLLRPPAGLQAERVPGHRVRERRPRERRHPGEPARAPASPRTPARPAADLGAVRRLAPEALVRGLLLLDYRRVLGVGPADAESSERPAMPSDTGRLHRGRGGLRRLARSAGDRGILGLWPHRSPRAVTTARFKSAMSVARRRATTSGSGARRSADG